MEHFVRAAVPRRVFWSLLPAALTACTFDPAGLADRDGQVATPADAAYSEFTDAAIDAATVDVAVVADAPPPDAPPPPDAAPPPDARVCPPSYTVLPATGHAYRVRRARQPWFQAKDSCERTGTGIHLAVLDDAAELAAVQTLIDVPVIWIGMNDVDQEGHFVVVTGGPAIFHPWGAGEPNNAQGGEDCVELIGAKLNDDACDTPLPFLCECE
jgi:hypothetical protein